MPTEPMVRPGKPGPHQELGLTIQRARQRAGMTQQEMAGKLGVDRSAVANWERGRYFPGRYAGAIEQLLSIEIPARPAA